MRCSQSISLRLLTSFSLNRRLRVQGRAWVEATYGWQQVYGRVDAIYARLLAGQTAAASMARADFAAD